MSPILTIVHRSRVAAVLSSVLLFGLTGCAHQAEEVAEAAAPAGAEGILQELAQPQNQDLLEQLAARTAAGTTRGAIQGILGQQRAAVDGSPTTGPATTQALDEASAAGTMAEGIEQRVTPVLTRSVDEVGQVVGRSLQRDVAPGAAAVVDDSLASLASSIEEDLAPALGRAVNDGLRQFLAGEGDEAVRQFIQPVARETGRSLMDGVAEGLEQRLAPAIEASIREQAPAVRAILQEEVRLAFDETNLPTTALAAETSRAVSREATLGMRDALVEMDVLTEKGQLSKSVMPPQGLFGWGISLAALLAGLFGLLVVALAIGVVVLLLRSRRERAEAERRIASTRELSEALRTTEIEQLPPDLRQRLRDRLAHSDDPDLRAWATSA